MKLTFIFVLLGLMSFASVTYSQSTRLSFESKNVTIESVFKQIETLSEYKFAYNSTKLDVDKRISLKVEDLSIDAILDKILGSVNFKYQIVDRYIIITDANLDNPNSKGNNMQQQKSVSGKVTDATKSPLPGVSVVVKGTTNGTITDSEGHYSLTNIPANATLQFSFVGMKTQEIVIGSNPTINVTLADESIGIEEVVAIGYGTMKAGDITSSVASVKSENFVKGAVKDIGQLVIGKVAGLVITNPSGDPSAGTQLKIRGTSTFGGANTEPLVLIDGAPGDLKTVAPEDVESVEVLKDGSAAAIYGTRGTNGVVLVTTKQFSKNGGNISKVEYSGYISTSQIAKRPEMLSAGEFRAMYPNEVDNGANTDWLDQITRTPFSQVHNLTLQGGNSKTNYIANANYNSSQGIMLESDNETFKGRFQVDHSMFDDKLQLKMGIIGKLNEHPAIYRWENFVEDASFSGWTYRMAVSRKPTDPVKNADGSWHQNTAKFEYENPVSNIKESDGNVKDTEVRVNSNIIFKPTSDLTLSAVTSYTRSHRAIGYSETLNHISTLRDGKNGWCAIGSRTNTEKLAELTALYKKDLDNHRFSLLGGYSYNENDVEGMEFVNFGFQDNYFGGWHNIGLGAALKEGKSRAGSWKFNSNLIGFFGRGTYSYKDKYLLMGSLRYEGASQLWGTDNEWGLFPSVSLGWRITEESFMQSQQLFDNLKLRVGYGVTGSQPNTGFLGVAMLRYDQYAYVNGQWKQTIVPASNANPDLKWEEKKETNIGLDFSSLNGRLSGSLDLYNRKVDGLLYEFTVSVPPYDYGTITANGGVMENKGVEVLLSGIPVKKRDFEWTTSLTFSTNNNKLKSINGKVFKTDYDFFDTGWIEEPIKTQSHRVQVGDRVGNFWGYKVIDVDANGKWIYEKPNGELVPFDKFSHNIEDKQVIGNGLPTMYAGWNNSIRYKNFDFSMTMRGAFDYQIINEARMYFENPKNSRNENRLRSVNDLVFGKTKLNNAIDPEFNSYYVEDGDYWKIDNITLGYTLQNVGKYIQSIRFYGSALNVATFTGYKGVDPEVSTNGLAPGFDPRVQYPRVRLYTFGVNVSF